MSPLERSLAAFLLALGAAGCATSATSPDSAPSPHASTPLPALPATIVEGEHFAVFGAEGAPATLDDAVEAAAGVDVIFLGEEHDDRVGHRVQLAVLERAFLASEAGADRPLVLSLEMFERDVQGVVDEYLADLITEEHFLSSARPWSNYEEAYRPLLEFARAHDVPVVASNAPRRYVNRASRLGRESLRDLPDEALATLPPLPYPEASEAYRAQWDSVMGDAVEHMSGSPLDGQTLWDATMAHSIARTLETRPGGLVLHLAGGFHVERGTGVPEALRHYRPGTRMLVVAVQPVEEPVGGFEPGEHGERGDFVILTDGRWRGGGTR